MLQPRHRRLGLATLGSVLVVMLAALAGSAGAAAALDDAAPGVQVESGLVYGTRTPQQVLDLYHLVGGTRRPVVVLVHGGGWRAGDKATFAGAARGLAAKGFLVANVNYTLGPAGVPAYQRQTEDVRTAVSWIRAQAARYGGDPERLALVGGSAGGYLVAMVATSINTAGDAPVKAAVSLSGPMDIAALVAGLRGQQQGPCTAAACAERGAAVADLRALLGCAPLACAPALVEQASPVTHVNAFTPPFFLANSTLEVIPAAQARRMAAALRAHGIEADLDILPGDEHSLQYAGLVAGEVVDFLRAHLGTEQPARPVVTPRADSPHEQRTPVRRHVALVIVLATAVLGAGALGLRRLQHRIHDR
jgi:acetyl esterase/lipase